MDIVTLYPQRGHRCPGTSYFLIIKKISYERRAYESVDEKSLY